MSERLVQLSYGAQFSKRDLNEEGRGGMSDVSPTEPKWACCSVFNKSVELPTYKNQIMGNGGSALTDGERNEFVKSLLHKYSCFFLVQLYSSCL
jgi:hypothetical protein